MTKQPKFAVGQVVACLDGNRMEGYFLVVDSFGVERGYPKQFYALDINRGCKTGLMDRPESCLRPLTRKEIGPRREQGRKKR